MPEPDVLNPADIPLARAVLDGRVCLTDSDAEEGRVWRYRPPGGGVWSDEVFVEGTFPSARAAIRDAIDPERFWIEPDGDAPLTEALLELARRFKKQDEPETPPVVTDLVYDAKARRWYGTKPEHPCIAGEAVAERFGVPVVNKPEKEQVTA